jgi:hypothetical protein
MVNTDTFVMAAHCTSDWPADMRFYVSLDQDVQSGLDAAAGQYAGDPSAIARAVGVAGWRTPTPAIPVTPRTPTISP